MDCNIIKDLLPLYIDGCCSKESKRFVEEHIECCDVCKNLLEDMNSPSDVVIVSQRPIKFSKLNDWKASVLQSILLYASFLLITIGVALEAKTPSGLMNGFWAVNLIIPSTGFMLSLTNWYFVRIYKSRKRFSDYSLIATFGITLCAYIWSAFHYGTDINNGAELMVVIQNLLTFNGLGFLLTSLFCVLSKTLSNQYAKMLGKE